MNGVKAIIAVASGKGGVGKSSVTVNLAAALAAKGLAVGVLDADVYGHSVPHMMGSEDKPHQVDDMIMPPQAHGVSLISIGHFVDDNAPVVWRGPMLHRAIQQFRNGVDFTQVSGQAQETAAQRGHALDGFRWLNNVDTHNIATRFRQA